MSENRYMLSLFVGPCSAGDADAFACAILDLPEAKPVHAGAVGITLEPEDGQVLTAATYKAVRRALNWIDATDPCPFCNSWPSHAESCVMAARELDDLIGRLRFDNPPIQEQT